MILFQSSDIQMHGEGHGRRAAPLGPRTLFVFLFRFPKLHSSTQFLIFIHSLRPAVGRATSESRLRVHTLTLTQTPYTPLDAPKRTFLLPTYVRLYVRLSITYVSAVCTDGAL